jgi:Reverse transcriptase (RNA-dependent DNA polymerase)
LVAKGYTQTYDLHYQEIFALVAKMSTVRILLSVDVNMGWYLSQMNVKKNILTRNTRRRGVYDSTSKILEWFKQGPCMQAE